MNVELINERLKAVADVVRLSPQLVPRFYPDANRLGQRPADAPKPKHYCPERWIGSTVAAANPPQLPPGGLSTCADLIDGNAVILRDLLAHPKLGPRLLGEKRFENHAGTFRVLVKLLDALYPIAFHVHADDRFVATNPDVYPNEKFGKDEAYYFLDQPKGDCPYTHIGLYDGITADDLLSAMNRSTDHVLELSPGSLQRFGEGFFVKAGLLHRPGSALTLEIQQPSDVYTMFQNDFGGQPLPQNVQCPGFDSLEQAAAAVVNWNENYKPDLLKTARLQPTPVVNIDAGDGKVQWVYPPDITDKFSGMRLTVNSTLTFKVKQPFILYVWDGQGKLDDQPLCGARGVGTCDEFFVGIQAAQRGIQVVNTADRPIVAFALFAATV